ncbi:hypothetical protein SLINC_0230 [Streptomyces lincolnensis]|uniref:YqeB PH domain-containing protein n=1 Tax=Streptomyces lincolnensis TaxID=1915 RepID=A0A1B1M1X6_STRLN|nr:hypothetical protein [Streptomyces lincolnensis]ANS62454.1 hypothetical protein SLINC_0230 [Streptomyces lincolnensis]AXG51379.1 hypothetical protein SLCG_0224 [Streptomyces lincolnensis]QMV04443.1 hypothetical protein GJU35_01375 [Streptomyces lincolnensis]QMV11881.1 hypothetical protein GJU35_43545 [Streptomyces lincolnensis]
MNFRKHPASPTADATVVADSPLAIILVCTVGGTVLGGVGELVWEWMTTQSWGPRIGPTKLLSVLPSPWPTIVVAAVGAVAGLLLGLIAVHESVSVTVSATRVVLTVQDEQREFASHEIGQVLVARKQLILLDQNGQELTRQDCDLNPRRLVTAFTRHGYSCAESTPE